MHLQRRYNKNLPPKTSQSNNLLQKRLKKKLSKRPSKRFRKKQEVEDNLGEVEKLSISPWKYLNLRKRAKLKKRNMLRRRRNLLCQLKQQLQLNIKNKNRPKSKHPRNK